MLLDSKRIPLFEPTVYSLTQLRMSNLATNTIESSLRGIMILYLWLDLRDINIRERGRHGELLTLVEIESLICFCRLPMAEMPCRHVNGAKVLPLKVMACEKYRARPRPKRMQDVLPATAANRLRAIRDFLSWFSLVQLSRQNKQSSHYDSLYAARQMMIEAINVRIPECSRGSLGDREGLDSESRGILLQVVDSSSKNNPWKEEHSKHRNVLIVNMLYYLGLRRGELLGIRIPNIDFRGNTVIIVRRADDPKDPRHNQPNTKTKARKISFSSGLRDMIETYILRHRAAFLGAKKHDFLFVSTDSGAPLSISSLNKIFRILSMKCPELPKVYPHILRHTWNDRFSEEMDKHKESEETEKKTRAYIMGWCSTSQTAATYTKRHIREKANAVSLEMQTKMMGVEHDK